jgi:hypothetical protein
LMSVKVTALVAPYVKPAQAPACAGQAKFLA